MGKTHASLALLVLALTLQGCAGTVRSDAAAAPAVVADDLTQKDRVAFFVNHARNGETAEVEKALAARQSVDAVDPLGQTALIAAISHNSLATAQLLLQHQANTNIADDSGWTPVLYGAYFGASPELLTALLDHGADINARNNRGVTALYLASAAGHEEQVRFLLDHGADRSLASQAGYTPLRIAKLRGLGKIVAMLDTAPAATSVH